MMTDNGWDDNELKPYNSEPSLKDKTKEVGETAAGIGCFTLGCLGQTALSGVWLVVQLFIGLFVLGFLARIFGCA